MAPPKKYQSSEEAKTAHKENIRKHNETYKEKEKLFTKLANSAQKHLIKCLKSVLMTAELAQAIEEQVLKDPSIKMLAQENDSSRTTVTDDEKNVGTIVTLRDDGVIDIVSAGARKLKAKSKPKPKNEALLDHIEGLFQKYLTMNPLMDGFPFMSVEEEEDENI
jgi:hypothetical protein